MSNIQNKLLSRRAFARRAALFSASTVLISEGALAPTDSRAAYSPQLPADVPKLSPEGQAEAEARFQLVLSRHGSHLSEEDKRNIKTLSYYAQPGLERLRSFSLKNGDVPALFLKPLVEREKSSQSKQTAAPATPNHS